MAGTAQLDVTLQGESKGDNWRNGARGCVTVRDNARAVTTTSRLMPRIRPALIHHQEFSSVIFVFAVWYVQQSMEIAWEILVSTNGL